MHEVLAKSILSAHNGINVYRGCTHGCIYCDSRSTCYQMDHAFEDVAVKVNAAELLEDSLRRKRHPCMVGTGSMCDPLSAFRGGDPADQAVPGGHLPAGLRRVRADQIRPHSPGHRAAGGHQYPGQGGGMHHLHHL